MEYIVIFILLFAVVILSFKLYVLRKQIKSILHQLDDYENKLITIELTDGSLEEMTRKINSMIDCIRQIRVDAEKNSAVLKESVADISHDMRTPLTSVIGYLQLALKNCDDENVGNDIATALERAKYCNTLIDDFFELSVVDAHGGEPVFEKVNLDELLCELILANYPSFEAKNVVPHYKEASAPIFVSADKSMLTRIIQNLISNTIKYSTGNVEFTINAEERVILTVANQTNECDIDIDRIFEKFFRQDKSRKSNGSGIGLYICKEFAEIMGGNIHAVFSEGVLKFVLELDRA